MPATCPRAHTDTCPLAVVRRPALVPVGGPCETVRVRDEGALVALMPLLPPPLPLWRGTAAAVFGRTAPPRWVSASRSQRCSRYREDGVKEGVRGFWFTPEARRCEAGEDLGEAGGCQACAARGSALRTRRGENGVLSVLRRFCAADTTVGLMLCSCSTATPTALLGLPWSASAVPEWVRAEPTLRSRTSASASPLFMAATARRTVSTLDARSSPAPSPLLPEPRPSFLRTAARASAKRSRASARVVGRADDSELSPMAASLSRTRTGMDSAIHKHQRSRTRHSCRSTLSRLAAGNPSGRGQKFTWTSTFGKGMWVFGGTAPERM